MGLAAGSGHLRTRTGPKDAALRKARVCYNHMAGDMGTRLFDNFTDRNYLRLADETLVLTGAGAAFAADFGIDLDKLQTGKAPLCRDCLDWSERRSHLAGSLGRALLSRVYDLGWAAREADSRVVTFSQQGERRFVACFGDLG